MGLLLYIMLIESIHISNLSCFYINIDTDTLVSYHLYFALVPWETKVQTKREERKISSDSNMEIMKKNEERAIISTDDSEPNYRGVKAMPFVIGTSTTT